MSLNDQLIPASGNDGAIIWDGKIIGFNSPAPMVEHYSGNVIGFNGRVPIMVEHYGGLNPPTSIINPLYPNPIPSTPNSFDNSAGATVEPFSQTKRKCRLVCDNDQEQKLHNIAARIIGLTLQQARSIYPNVREVIRNGQPLVITQEYNPNRINVETKNGKIIRFTWFY